MTFTDMDPGRAAADLLAWYAEMGIDAVLDEAPHDRFAESPVRRLREPEPAKAPAGGAAAPATRAVGFAGASASADDVASEARMLARSAKSLDELKTLLAAFEGCALKLTAHSLVFADGTPGSRVMLVGEAPGAEEDRTGLPFVGRSGRLLDLMLAAIGLDRTKVYIANIIPWRPPGNRTPTPQEAAVCRPFIARQIELADPDILVCLGAPAAASLLGAKEGIGRTRGKWTTYDTGTRTVKAIATLHPAYLLRQPLQKRLAWRDLKAIRAALEG